MSINAVQKNADTNGTNYVNATILGGITGYAAKYLIPINSSEKAEINNQLKLERDLFKASKNQEVELIRFNHQEVKGADEFLKLYDNAKSSNGNFYSEFKKLPKEIQENVKKVIQRINNVALDQKVLEREKLIAFNKSLRPNHVFVFAGAVCGCLTALIDSNKNKRKQEIE